MVYSVFDHAVPAVCSPCPVVSRLRENDWDGVASLWIGYLGLVDAVWLAS